MKPYKGHLSIQETASGMQAARANARRLYSDAKVLFDHGSFPTACSLAILAIEEAGKLPILRGMLAIDTKTSPKRAWRRYRSHRSKNVLWTLGDEVKKGARKLTDLTKLFEEDAQHPGLLDRIKQLGFYTDTFAKGAWAEPTEIIDKTTAEKIMEVANVLVMSGGDVTERELELWVEIVQPKTDTREWKAALKEWHEKMLEEGLTDIKAETIEQWL